MKKILKTAWEFLKNKATDILNYRYYVLGVLGVTSFLFIFGEEDWSIEFIEWLKSVIVDKTFGILCGFAAYKLYKFWDSKGRVPFVSKMVKDEWEDKWHDERM